MMVSERCFVIEVRTRKEWSKAILVSDDAREIYVSDNFNIVFAVPKIRISFIDEPLRELELLTFDQFNLIYSCVSSNTVFFSILSFQLDDLYPDVSLPVALFSIPRALSLLLLESFVRGASPIIHSYIERYTNRHSGKLNRSAAETIGDGFCFVLKRYCTLFYRHRH